MARTRTRTVHAISILSVATAFGVGFGWVDFAHAVRKAPPVDARSGKSQGAKPKYTKEYVIEHYMYQMGTKPSTYVGGQELIYNMIARLTAPSGRRSVFLKAPAGVGKTALVNEVARQLISKGYRIFGLDLNKLRAGTSLQGEVEDRYESVMAAFAGQREDIPFIDEVAGIQASLKDLLKVPLQDDTMAAIINTTPDELRDSKLEDDKAFISRFKTMDIPNADFEKIVSIIDGLRASGVEEQYGVRTASDVPEAIASAVLQYFPNDPVLRVAEDIYLGILADEKTARELGPRDSQRLLEQRQRLEMKIKRLNDDIPFTLGLDPETREIVDTTETTALRTKIEKHQAELNRVNDQITKIEDTHDLALAPKRLIQFQSDLHALMAPGKKRSPAEEAYRVRLQAILIPLQERKIKDSQSPTGQIRLNRYNVAQFVGRMRGIPPELIAASVSERLGLLIRELAKVEGHRAAKKMLIESARLWMTEMKPLQNFATLVLLDGASGMGKTELIERFAIGLYGSLEALLTLELATYGHNAESRLLGAGPSFVNSERGGALEPVRKNPSMVINGDEFDKISKAILEILHHPFDKGKMKDAMGRDILFNSAHFVGSSNYTQRYAIYKDQTTDNRAIEEDLNLAVGSLGDLPPGQTRDNLVLELRMLATNVSPSMLTRLRNRAVLDALTPVRASRITRRMANAYAKMIALRLDWDFQIDRAVGEFIGNQMFTWEGGGREFAAGIERYIATPLAKLITDVDRQSAANVRKGLPAFQLGAGTKIRVKLADVPATDGKPAMKELQFFVESPHFVNNYADKDDPSTLLPVFRLKDVPRVAGPPPRLVWSGVKGEKPYLSYDHETTETATQTPKPDVPMTPEEKLKRLSGPVPSDQIEEQLDLFGTNCNVELGGTK